MRPSTFIMEIGSFLKRDQCNLEGIKSLTDLRLNKKDEPRSNAPVQT